jgi:hypothetical protein
MLDSKQKRGSALDVGQPQRQWLAEPDGALADTDRASLLKLCSAVAPAAPPAAGDAAGGGFRSGGFGGRVLRAGGRR